MTRPWLGHSPDLPQASRALLASQCTIMCHSLDCCCVVTKRLRTAIASQRSWYIPTPSIWYCDILNPSDCQSLNAAHVLLLIPEVLIPSYCAHSGPSQHPCAVLESQSPALQKHRTLPPSISDAGATSEPRPDRHAGGPDASFLSIGMCHLIRGGCCLSIPAVYSSQFFAAWIMGRGSRSFGWTSPTCRFNNEAHSSVLLP